MTTLPKFHQSTAVEVTCHYFNQSVDTIIGRNLPHVFAIEAGTRLYPEFYWWHEAPEKYMPFLHMRGDLSGDPIPVVLESGELIVFAHGSDGFLWYKTFSQEEWLSCTDPWTKYGGYHASLFAIVWLRLAVQSAVSIVARGREGYILRTHLDDRVIVSMGRNYTSQPAAVSLGSERLTLFAGGIDEAIRWNSWNGTTWVIELV